MKLTEIGTIVAITVGIYSAILSTFLLFRKIRSDRRVVRVVCERTLEKWPEDSKTQPIPKYAAITIRGINVSHRPVVIIAAGFILSDKSKNEKVGEEAGLPIKLGDGESVGITFGIASLERFLEREIPIYKNNSLKSYIKKITGFLARTKFQSPIYFNGESTNNSEKEILENKQHQDNFKSIQLKKTTSIMIGTYRLGQTNIPEGRKTEKVEQKKENKIKPFITRIKLVSKEIIEIFIPLRGLRVRWPVTNDYIFIMRLSRYLDNEGYETEFKPVNIKYAFVRDIEGREYTTPFPRELVEQWAQ